MAVASLIKIKHLQPNQQNFNATDSFSTEEGHFKTLGNTNVNFSLPEFTTPRNFKFAILNVKIYTMLLF